MQFMMSPTNKKDVLYATDEEAAILKKQGWTRLFGHVLNAHIRKIRGIKS